MDYIFNNGEKISVKDISRKLELIEDLNRIGETRKEMREYSDSGGSGKLYNDYKEVEKTYEELFDLQNVINYELRKYYGKGYSYKYAVLNIIYGDGYKILVGENHLTVIDYDENQELKAEISIKFSREELKQLADLLSK